MERYQPFHLFTRKTKSGKKVYHARFIDTETGRPLFTKSTGVGNKVHASRIAERILKEFHDGKSLAKVNTPTIAEYAGSFFLSGGPYERRKKQRGYAVAENNLYTNRNYVKNHIIPYWGSFRIHELTIDNIDHRLLQMSKDGYAGSTVNRCLRVLRLILDGAILDEYIAENPAARVKPFKESKTERGVLTKSEVTRLFAVPDVWKNFTHYTLCLTTFTTGMRIAEIRGLCVENVFPDYIAVRTQWEDGYGLKPPKARSIRDVAIPPSTASALSKCVELNRPEGIVFYSPKSKAIPMSKSHIENNFYTALHGIGISEEERRERVLVFHSLRHTLNSILRSEGIPDAKVKRITGHRTDEMMESYTHFKADDFRDVSSIVSGLIEGLSHE